MIVLDTNVVSELMRSTPSAGVVASVDAWSTDAVCLTAITVAELLYGIARLPDGRRKAELAALVESMLSDDFDDRVLAFDAAAAAHYADIVASRERSGRPVSAAAAQIAAICRSYGAILATRNVADFVDVGLQIVNPWS